MLDEKKQQLLNAVWKKALGYQTIETTEEFNVQDGQLEVSKQRTATKDVPPDLSAVKFLMDGMQDDYSAMTDQQLEAEKQRLLKLLKKNTK